MIRKWFMTRQAAEIKEFKIPEGFRFSIFSRSGGFDPAFSLPVENLSFADFDENFDESGFSEIRHRVFGSIATLADDRFRGFWLR